MNAKTSDAPHASQHQPLCEVCGNLGSKKCSQCHQVNYCSKKHQVFAWKGGHKNACGQKDSKNTGLSILFPEHEIIIESEELDQEEEKSEEQRLREYAEFTKAQDSTAAQFEADDKDLENMALSEHQSDKIFQAFQERIKLDPDQVLRYQRGGEPLWVSAEGKPASIPPCDNCGAERQFEFQILPQLLSHLAVDSLGDSLDWGSLMVYTCAKNCDIGNTYRSEFVWKQDFSNTDIGKG